MGQVERVAGGRFIAASEMVGGGDSEVSLGGSAVERSMKKLDLQS
jgi:hypothetical protein